MLLLSLLALATSGCSEQPEMPSVKRLQPDHGAVGVATRVTVIGARFYAAVQTSFDDEKRSKANTKFSLWLGDTLLDSVRWLSATQLSAIVPATLPTGRYALRLLDPRGREATLDNAFIVGSPPTPDARPDSVEAGADSRLDSGDDATDSAVDATPDGADAGVDGAPDSADAASDTTADSADAGRDTTSDSADATVDTNGPDATVDTLAPDTTVDTLGPDATVDTLAPDATVDTIAPDASVDTLSPDSSVDSSVDGSVDSGTIVPTVQLVASDPFGDGTPFLFVFEHDGELFFGPNKSGTGALRAKPDGSALAKAAFSFPADTNGNKTDNNRPPPYPSIGATGCQKDTYACGPHNEDGRGLFASGVINGTPWLVIAGARTSGDFDYIYMTPSTVSSTITFRYVDIHRTLGGGTKGISAMHVIGDRVYLGFPDSGGSRPYLVVLKTTPSAPGLDASATADAEDLRAKDMPGVGKSANVSMIDTITDFAGRLYLANNGGCMRATVARPRDYDDEPQDWAVCTPSASGYTSKTSVTTNKVSDLEPRDKAVPQMASYKGRLYMARNTTAGPQLWSCAPATSGDATQCDPGDWSLVAADAAGRSRFGNSNNSHITMLTATPTALYVGYDNAVEGVVVFRSTAAAPAVAADFEGQSGCSAALFTCQGIGGNGLGVATNRRILHAITLRFTGNDYVYLTTGDSASAARVYRIVQ